MTVENAYALAADLLVVLHFFYVLFVVVGEIAIVLGWFFRWSWIRDFTFRVLHLISIAVVAVQAVSRIPCPLTIWEYQLREKAGQAAQWDVSFVARLLRAIIFYDLPGWFFMMLYTGFAAVVFLTLILIPPRRKKQSRLKKSP